MSLVSSGKGNQYGTIIPNFGVNINLSCYMCKSIAVAKRNAKNWNSYENKGKESRKP